jgi:hypothetical protein
MKVHVKHSLKTDVASAFKLCTELKSQESIYAKLGGSDVKIKRDGRAPTSSCGSRGRNLRIRRRPSAGSCRARPR